jgi:hypothetical protein
VVLADEAGFSHQYRTLNSMQEDLTPETAEKILNAFKKGEKPHPGPQSGRKSCENSAGLTALTEAPPGPGFKVRADL